MKNILLISSLLLICIYCSSCGDSEKKDNKKSAAVEKPKQYDVVTLQPHQINGSAQLPGVMQPFEFVQIFPKVSGFVKSVLVDRGSVVKEGQLLLTLEAPEVAQHVAAARLQYAQAQATYLTSKDRYKRLLETSATPGTVSAYDLEAARSKMQADSATAQGEYANYKAQEVMQSYLRITSPFNGIITERNVHPGALAGPGAQNAKPMLVLQQLSKLRLVVDVPEQYASQIKDNDEVHYKVNALPGKSFTGTVSRSSQSLSSNYRSETIEIDVPNTGDQFKPGMYAEVVLPTSGNVNAFVVPRSAVVTTTEHKFVIVANDNVAKLIDVSEGNQNKDSTEVFGNLHDGDKLIVQGSYTIKDGQALSIK